MELDCGGSGVVVGVVDMDWCVCGWFCDCGAVGGCNDGGVGLVGDGLGLGWCYWDLD